MPRGWSANSLIPAGLGGFSGGSNIVSRGSLAGGLAPTAPMNTINGTMPGGTGVPPFVSSALNPFLNAVIGQQNRANAPAAVPNITINTAGNGDQARLEAQRAASRAAAATSWNLDSLRHQLGGIQTGFGGITPMGGVQGAQRADLQMRILGLENTLGQQQAAAFGMSPMGGWSNTFRVPTY